MDFQSYTLINNSSVPKLSSDPSCSKADKNLGHQLLYSLDKNLSSR